LWALIQQRGGEINFRQGGENKGGPGAESWNHLVQGDGSLEKRNWKRKSWVDGRGLPTVTGLKRDQLVGTGVEKPHDETRKGLRLWCKTPEGERLKMVKEKGRRTKSPGAGKFIRNQEGKRKRGKAKSHRIFFQL